MTDTGRLLDVNMQGAAKRQRQRDGFLAQRGRGRRGKNLIDPVQATKRGKGKEKKKSADQAS